MNIGGVLFGTGFYSTIPGNPTTTAIADGKIGIGTNSPNNTLEINSGSTTNSGLRFTQLNASSSTSTPNGKALSVNASGDVILIDSVGCSGSNCVLYL